MSFLNIKDGKKRDEIVAEYLATVKRLQKRDIDERSKDLAQSEAIEQSLEPVVRSTDKSTEAITKQLIPIKEEIIALNNKLKNVDDVQNKQMEVADAADDDDEPNTLERIYQQVPREKLDKYFGIVQATHHRYIMGNKIIQVVGSDIVVDNVRYEGSQGFWSLVMMRHPKDYSERDLRKYRDLITHTNAMIYPNNLQPTSNVKLTTKW